MDITVAGATARPVSERSLDDVVVASPFFDRPAHEAAEAVVQEFNQGRPSIMVNRFQGLLRHIRIEPDEFCLVHHNSIPELVSTSERPLRTIKKPFDLGFKAEIISKSKQDEPIIGDMGHFVINVPSSKYAKIYDGPHAALLGPGQHVVHSPRLRFDPERDLVDQRASYVQHNDIHILRVPPGKLATVMADNEHYILTSRSAPYVFKTLQFRVDRGPEHGNLFHPTNSKIIEFGPIKRLLPDLGEVAIVNQGGTLRVHEPKLQDEIGGESKGGEADTMAITVNDSSARFDGFLSLNLQNLEFPRSSQSSYAQYYTKDAVKVGVRFFVCYRVTDPHEALSRLRLHDIEVHIEGVVDLDMGRAIQETSIQNLLSSDQSTIGPSEGAGAAEHESGLISGEGTEYFQYWQDQVKHDLCKDLAAYGIELVRLNITEAKILEAEVERQMSQQAIQVAKACADREAQVVQFRVEQQKRDHMRSMERQQFDHKKLLDKDQAEHQRVIDLYERETAKQVAQTDAEADDIRDKHKHEDMQKIGKILRDYPELASKNMAEQFAEALQGAHLSSPLPLQDLWKAFNSIQEHPSNRPGPTDE